MHAIVVLRSIRDAQRRTHTRSDAPCIGLCSRVARCPVPGLGNTSTSLVQQNCSTTSTRTTQDTRTAQQGERRRPPRGVDRRRVGGRLRKWPGDREDRRRALRVAYCRRPGTHHRRRARTSTCVEIKFRMPHAIDATLSRWPRRLDGITTLTGRGHRRAGAGDHNLHGARVSAAELVFCLRS